MPAPLLSIDNLSITTSQGKVVVTNASLTVDSSEILAIIGPNGCGKSSLLKAITGENKITAGEILFQGKPLNHFSRLERAKRIAILSQDDNADSRMRIYDYVALGRYPHHHSSNAQQDHHIITQSLDECGLATFARRTLGSLSGGEKQRANLARTFAQKPQLLLLDEPTNHLDPLARSYLLERVKSKKIACIAVLHDLHLISPFADKTAIMQNKKILAVDATESLLDSEFIQRVFGLSSFKVPHPELQKTIRIFETPDKLMTNLAVNE